MEEAHSTQRRRGAEASAEKQQESQNPRAQRERRALGLAATRTSSRGSVPRGREQDGRQAEQRCVNDSAHEVFYSATDDGAVHGCRATAGGGIRCERVR